MASRTQWLGMCGGCSSCCGGRTPGDIVYEGGESIPGMFANPTFEGATSGQSGQPFSIRRKQSGTGEGMSAGRKYIPVNQQPTQAPPGLQYIPGPEDSAASPRPAIVGSVDAIEMGGRLRPAEDVGAPEKAAPQRVPSDVRAHEGGSSAVTERVNENGLQPGSTASGRDAVLAVAGGVRYTVPLEKASNVVKLDVYAQPQDALAGGEGGLQAAPAKSPSQSGQDFAGMVSAGSSGLVFPDGVPPPSVATAVGDVPSVEGYTLASAGGQPHIDNEPESPGDYTMVVAPVPAQPLQPPASPSPAGYMNASQPPASPSYMNASQPPASPSYMNAPKPPASPSPAVYMNVPTGGAADAPNSYENVGQSGVPLAVRHAGTTFEDDPMGTPLPPRLQPRAPVAIGDDPFSTDEEGIEGYELAGSKEVVDQCSSSPTSATVEWPAPAADSSAGVGTYVADPMPSGRYMNYSVEKHDAAVAPPDSMPRYATFGSINTSAGVRGSVPGSAVKDQQQKSSGRRWYENCLPGGTSVASVNPLYEEWVEPMVGDSTYNYVQSVLEVKGSILDRAVVERTRVTMGRRIGQGMFGVVLAGILAGEDGGESVAVAIKTLQRRDGETDKIMERNLAELADEAALAGSFLHPNVVQLLGVCCSGKLDMMVLFEFCEKGSLEGMLQDGALNKQTFEDFGPARLVGFMIDVAAAMAYLAALRCVHRDLATRNILISASDDAKVADFGMGRRVSATTASYEMVTHRQLPARWMAPEALRKGVATTEGDVWSFGVTLWETASMATLPFDHCDDWRSIMLAGENGEHLRRPSGCPGELYRVMQSCWVLDTEMRPSFGKLKQALIKVHDGLALAPGYNNWKPINASAPATTATSAKAPQSDAELEKLMQQWKILNLSGENVEKALLGHSTGAFCVRSSASNADVLVLCVRTKAGRMEKFRVREAEGKTKMLDVQGELPTFPTLVECIKFFRQAGNERALGLSLTYCISPLLTKVEAGKRY